MLRAVFAHVFCLAHFTIDEKGRKKKTQPSITSPGVKIGPIKKKKGVNNLGVCVCV